MEGILKALLARQESAEKSHRVKGGKRLSAERGRRNGGPRPFGYLQRDRELVAVPAEVAVLRRMRDEVLAGLSLRDIARGLNEDGVRTVRGVPWSQTRVGQVLRNRLYVGKVRNRDAEFDGNHEPVFSEPEWAELQAALRSRRRGERGAARVPRAHLLPGGTARCGC
jgi:site-specific DNA recombinase